MKEKFTCIITLTFLILFQSHNSYAQSTNDLRMYGWLDSTLGKENTGLFNGVEYVEQHRTINEKHKFFKREFIPGTLLYGNQPYPEVLMNYNIYDQVLLVKAPTASGETIFQLINGHIGSFSIEGHNFLHIKEEKNRGFYEVLLENPSINLYKKHSKKINEQKNDRISYYEFEKEDNGYLVLYNASYHQINSRRDMIKLFPDHKKEIRQFYRTNKQMQRNDPDSFMRGLLTDITSTNPNEKYFSE